MFYSLCGFHSGIQIDNTQLAIFNPVVKTPNNKYNLLNVTSPQRQQICVNTLQ